jgi:hypothetical protein
LVLTASTLSLLRPLSHPLESDNGHVRVFAKSRFLRLGKVAVLRIDLLAER